MYLKMSCLTASQEGHVEQGTKAGMARNEHLVQMYVQLVNGHKSELSSATVKIKLQLAGAASCNLSSWRLSYKPRV